MSRRLEVIGKACGKFLKSGSGVRDLNQIRGVVCKRKEAWEKEPPYIDLE